jgi:hypothetical protein
MPLRAVCIAYVLGVVSWIPIVVVAIGIGRLLGQARETQTHAAQADQLLESGD